MTRIGTWIALLVFIFSGVAATAQSTPFLSDDEIRRLTNEISGDRAFEHIRVLTRWHRDSGMDGYFKAADYIVAQAKAAGLEDVRFIEQPLNGRNYTAVSAELWMVEPVERKLADIGDHALYLSDGSHDADATAEVVWVGGPDADEIDVAGKIVLTDGAPGDAVREYVWGKGAIGVIAYPTSEGKSPYDYPDQIAWTRISPNTPEGKADTFAFALPPRKGDALRRILQSDAMQDFFATGKRTRGGRIVVHAKVDTEFGSEEPGRTGFVEGWIRGTTYHDQQIVLTAHLQEEQGSANDDGSGSANLLEIGRTFHKLIAEGKIPRPRRDIRFWWTDEIYSEYRYFSDHPEVVDDFLADLHEDMVGADQKRGSRVQHLILAPQSRTSYLDSLFLSVGKYLIHTNNSYLPAGRMGGLPRPHSRAIYSTRGSRDGYHAEFVPHFSSSDHMTFLDAGVEVPAVALINWDDDFIHSSDDDLDLIDQTQLQRNAFYISAMAYALAFAKASDVPAFAAATYADGTTRLGDDLRVALDILSRDGGLESWKDARMLIEQGTQREERAIQSVTALSEENPEALRLVRDMRQRVEADGQSLMEDLESFYQGRFGSLPPALELTQAEQDAASRVPVNHADLGEYFQRRQQARARTDLHGLMTAEVQRFVDGHRSCYDIYKAVRAEALSNGSWYNGTVSLEDVVAVLESMQKAGAVELKP